MSDPTRFDLDDRQRAMLAEMGVRVWWPQTPVDAASVPAPESAAAPQLAQVVPSPAPLATPVVPAPSRPAPAPAPAPASAPRPKVFAPPALPDDAVPLREGVDQMDWDTLQTTVAQCRACGLCKGRKSPVLGVGERRAQWMVIADAPAENEAQQEGLWLGPSGKLLDNMLKALGLSRQTSDGGGVYITSPLQCRAAANRNPEPQELATCAPYLARQVALVQPRVILLMGRFAVRSVLQTDEPMGKLRGRLHTCQGVPVVVTYHPEYLLRNQADKAKAWADLLLALKSVQG